MTVSGHWRCGQCGYDLYGLSGEFIVCPECGVRKSYAALQIRPERPPVRRGQAMALGLLAGILVPILAGLVLVWWGLGCGAIVLFVLGFLGIPALLGWFEPQATVSSTATYVSPSFVVALLSIVNSSLDMLDLFGTLATVGIGGVLLSFIMFGMAQTWGVWREERWRTRYKRYDLPD